MNFQITINKNDYNIGILSVIQIKQKLSVYDHSNQFDSFVVQKKKNVLFLSLC